MVSVGVKVCLGKEMGVRTVARGFSKVKVLWGVCGCCFPRRSPQTAHAHRLYTHRWAPGVP